MHRNSVNLCYTENSYTFFFFFYKMQAHNNYLDQDSANGRLWSRGELQENSAWTLTTPETCAHFCRSLVSCPLSQTLRKQPKNATSISAVNHLYLEQNHLLDCIWKSNTAPVSTSRCYHCFYLREDNLINVLKNCWWQIGWSIASCE